MVVWSGKRVSEYVSQPPAVKINPNGVDIGVSDVWMFHPDSVSTLKGGVRTTSPEKQRILPDSDGFYNLRQGTYEVRLANRITVPSNAIGRGFPRSSLNRLGMLKAPAAVWDSGYSGFSTQTVYVPIRMFRIHKDEPWLQFTLEDGEPSDVIYQGHWQNEKQS
ncbi:MAG: hypothetical protein V1887_02285 [Candidatus Aenigmatarchaeota archaeon]